MTQLRNVSPPLRQSPDAVKLSRFAEKYRQYFPRVFAYVYGRVRSAPLAEDIVSEVFERAFVKVDSLRNEDAFGTWLFTIARNTITSHARQNFRHRQQADSDLLEFVAHGGPSVEGEIVHQEELATLVEQLSYLSQREQDIIALKFDAELSTAQIARILDISEGNVRVIIYRALRKLRDLMLKNESPDA